MWILLKDGDVIREGDEQLVRVVGRKGDTLGYRFVRLHAQHYSVGKPTPSQPTGDPYDSYFRRELKGWEAVRYALEQEVLGNDVEGCETTPWFWDCECEKHYIHSHKDAGYCDKCHVRFEEQPDSRKAEVVLKIIEENRQ